VHGAPIITRMISSPNVRVCALLLCVLLLPGCSIFGKRSAAKKTAASEQVRAEAARRPLQVGRIALVNTTDGFVLIDAASFPSARTGETWRAYSGDTVSAELRATDVRRRPWVIADIVTGEPKTGDMVMQPAGTEAGNTPRAEPVAPAPATPPATKAPPFWKRWLGRAGLGN
jgi:hypothetical protein